MTVIPVIFATDLDAARTLFRAYGDHLASAGIEVCLTGLADEIASLPGKHIEPNGTILVATLDDGTPAGCVALHQRTLADGEQSCELKRLYVTPAARGTGAGRALMQASIDWARSHNRISIVLDTHPEKMPEAGALYRRFGFHPIERFNRNPVPGIEFLRLSL